MQDNGCRMLDSWTIPFGMTDKQLDTRFSTRIASAELSVFRRAAKLDRRSVADAVRVAMELYVEKVYRDRGRTPPQMSEEADDAVSVNPVPEDDATGAPTKTKRP
jgi:hypothetical protein